MDKLYLGLLFISLLSSCITTKAPLVFSNGRTPAFTIGDCIVISKEFKERLRSDGTIKKVIYIDSFETSFGDGGYVLRMVHPKIGHPTYHTGNVTTVDRQHSKVDCLDD